MQVLNRKLLDKSILKKEILKVRETGIAYDMEEYIEGLVAAGVPVITNREDLRAVIWTVGLKQEFRGDAMKEITKILLDTAEKINCRFSIIAGYHKL
jgi:IclR family KDG regulon transcriptional repressor